MTPRSKSTIDVMLVFGVVGAAFALRLDNSPLNGTEALRAIPAMQMLRTGDWLVPRLWGAPYLAKPPMFPWLLAAASWATGSAAEWVFRLPSALAAGATASAIGIASNRWFGRPAGLIGGLSMLLIPGLWSQSLKADIDAAHTLAVTIAALGLLAARIRASTLFWTGLAIGAAMLMKGPAGLPVVAGAIVGRAIGAGSCRVLLDWRPYVAVALGVAIFGAWVFAAYLRLQDDPAGFDWRGANEVASRITAGGWEKFLGAIVMPLGVLVVAMPLSLLMHLAPQRATTDRLPPDARRLLRSALACIGVTLLLFALARTTNARYAFIALPLFGLLAGGVGNVWLGGLYGKSPDAALRFVVAGAGVALLIAITMFTVRPPVDASAWAAMILSALCAAGLAAALLRRRHAVAMNMLAAMAVLTIGPYAAIRSDARWRESTADASRAMREAAGTEPILTDAWMMTGPALFHYAGASPVWRPGLFAEPHPLPPGAWALFHEAEWARWSESGAATFDRVIVLSIDQRAPVLARVSSISPEPASAAFPGTGVGR